MTGADPYDQLSALVAVLPVHMASGSDRYPLQHTPSQLQGVADPRCPMARMAAVIGPGLAPEPLTLYPGHQGRLQGILERPSRSQLSQRLTPQHLADALQEPFPDAQMPLNEHTRPRNVRDACPRGPP